MSPESPESTAHGAADGPEPELGPAVSPASAPASTPAPDVSQSAESVAPDQPADSPTPGEPFTASSSAADGAGSASEPPPAAVRPVYPAAPRWAVVALCGYLIILGAAMVTWHLDWPGLGAGGAAIALDARALRAAHQWLPTLDPGAFYRWTQALLFEWLGESTWAARLPGTGGALVLLVALLFAVRPSRTAPSTAVGSAQRPAGAFLAAAALLVCLPLWTVAARTPTPVAAGGLWGAAALAILLGTNSRRGPTPLRGALFFLCGVLAWLLGAGPLAVVLPWGALALHLLISGEWRALRRFANHRGAWGALLILVIIHAVMLYASPPVTRNAFVDHLRLLSHQWLQPPHPDWRGQLPWLGHLPLLLFLPAGVARISRERIARLALIALLLAFGLSLLTPVKPLLAAILALPASAQLAARVITARWGQGGRRQLPELWLLVALLLLAAAVVIATPPQLPPSLTVWWLGAAPGTRLVAGGAAAIIALLLAAGLLLRRPALAATVAITAVAAAWGTLFSLHGLDLDRALSHRPFLLELQAAPASAGQWVVLAPVDPSVAFYLGRPVTVAADSTELAALVAASSRPLNVIASAGMPPAGGAQRRLETRDDTFVPPPWRRPQLAWWTVAPPRAPDQPPDFDPNLDPQLPPILQPPPDSEPELPAAPSRGVLI